MTSIDEIWASMNETSATTKTGDKRKKSSKITSNKQSKDKSYVDNTNGKVTISYDDMRIKISRDVNATDGNEEVGVRKKAMQRLYKLLFEDHDMSNEDYGRIFRDICKAMFKRYSDPVEKCRELAQRITLQFFQRCYDFSAILGYYFPALMQRLPAGLAYDDDMKVFVTDMEAHEAYRRGKALDRQDKEGSASGGVVAHRIEEPSEEIRLITCTAVHALVKQVCDLDSASVLHAYFQDVVMFVQAQLRDPYPDLKVVACSTLELLATVEDFEIAMKLYAVGLVRGILPVLRHRHAKVRVAAVTALRYVMTVPDRAKRKAAGSDAIPDMVGFREENVLQIAAFYRPDVQINYLAELVTDKSVLVREKLVDLLTDLLTVIGDRYDHQTRLLPYLLDLLTDEVESVARAALACLTTCGRQYEEDHFDEITERRQYGVDGDDRINLSKPFPPPFQERPRLGIRLYVRGNTKRFLTALVGELTNWVSTTRLKSAQLLKVVIVLCEEHLTMEIHTLLPALIKALRFARDDKDVALRAVLLEVFELLGRYIAPEVYIYYLLPRLRGDADVVQFGVDADTRITVMEFLQALLSGSKPSLVPPFFEDIVAVLTDPFVISPDSVKLQVAAMDVLVTVLHSLRGKGHAVIESHFVATGRLTNLKRTIRAAFRFLLVNLSHPDLHSGAHVALAALCELEFDGANSGKRTSRDDSQSRCSDGVLSLFAQHGAALFRALADEGREYEVDAGWTATGSAEHVLLTRLVECPGYVLQRDEYIFERLLRFLCGQSRDCGHVGSSVEEDVLCALSDLLVSALQPVYYDTYETDQSAVYCAVPPRGDDAMETRSGLSVVDPTACAAAVFVVEKNLLEALMQCFVLDLRWSRSARLQTKRLQLLSLLLQLGTTGKSDYVPPALSGEVLVNYCSAIFDSLLVSASAPYHPVELRLGALDVASMMMYSVTAHTGHEKLKGFQHWAAADTPAVHDKVVSCKIAVQRGVSSALEMLNDSSDDVRLRALQTLNTAASLILSDSEAAAVVSPGGGATASFTVVVKVLLTQLCISAVGPSGSGADGDSFLDQVGSTLRTMAVLDPSHFESLVRETLAASGSEARVAETLSELVSHVDILQQLAKI